MRHPPTIHRAVAEEPVIIRRSGPSLKVKVTSYDNGYQWYRNNIGDIFEVERCADAESVGNCKAVTFRVLHPDGAPSCNLIPESHCEEVCYAHNPK